MEGDTHAFCVFFSPLNPWHQNHQLSPWGVRDVYRLWTYENNWKQMRHRRLNTLEKWHHKLWPQPVWMSRRSTSLSQVLPMTPMSRYDAFSAAQLATSCSTCNILSRARIRRLVSQSVRICKNVRLDNLFLKIVDVWSYSQLHPTKSFLNSKIPKETSTETMTAGAVMRGGGSKRSRVWPPTMDQKNGRLQQKISCFHHGWVVGNFIDIPWPKTFFNIL